MSNAESSWDETKEIKGVKTSSTDLKNSKSVKGQRFRFSSSKF
jgi:hypothetical protein